MKSIRVRYAPSPTGIPHIGNIRTALFNYLFAKNQEGEFLLRIEDTDQNRLVPGAVEKIKESLELLGLKWDEEEHQSKRLDLYAKHLDILKEKNLAYDDDGAWRFKVEKGKELEWDDIVHGPVKFSSDVIEDFIIIKSDGYPTYHFASVIDDHDLAISHVLRGDEWISSTPKHLLLYQSFGWKPPKFVHLPPILGIGHKKLSKRDGAKSVIEYINEGYLPEAIVNFMAFLGWSPKGNREFFSLQELIQEFSLDRINKNSPIFNLEKLNWFNSVHIKKLDLDELGIKLKNLSFAKQSESQRSTNPLYTSDDNFKKIIKLAQSRITTLKDFFKLADDMFFAPQIGRAATRTQLQLIQDLIFEFEKLANRDWKENKILSAIKVVLEKYGARMSEIYKIFTVSGNQTGLPLPESLEIIGKERVIERLERDTKLK